MNSQITTALSLYDIETYHQAMIESTDLVETPEDQAQFDLEMQQAIAVSVEKRDNVASFLGYLEQQQDYADAEIKRLQKLKSFWARIQERVERCIVRTILELGPNARGEHKKLAGKSNVLSIAANPPKLHVTNEPEVPIQYKVLTITVAKAAFEEFLDAAGIEEGAKFLAAVKKKECAVDKAAAKRNGDVPGTESQQGWRVVRQ